MESEAKLSPIVRDLSLKNETLLSSLEKARQAKKKLRISRNSLIIQRKKDGILSRQKMTEVVGFEVKKAKLQTMAKFQNVLGNS